MTREGDRIIREAAARRQQLREQVGPRVEGIQSDQAQAIREILTARIYEFSDWENGFLQSVSILLKNGTPLSEKQAVYLQKIREKTRGL